jgi:acylglycerol lipase
MDMMQAQNIAPQEERIEGTDGLYVFVRSWRPSMAPRAVVVIVPGFNSHSGYYLWAAEQLVAIGLAVYAVDLRGRGLSDGDRYHVNSFSEYVDDVHTVVTRAWSREPGRPVFILGHSAGGVISCMYALEHQAELAGLICESFAFQIPAPDFVLAVLKGLSHIAPNTHVLRLKIEDFSRDPQVVQAMKDDALVKDEVQPTQTVAEMVRADERLKEGFPSFSLPLLIIHGTGDKITRASGSQLFYDQAGSVDKTLKLYDGYAHDLLNDIGKEVVMADITSWIEGHVPSE